VSVAQESVTVLVASAQAAEGAGDWDAALALFESALEGASEEPNAARSCELLRCIGRVHFERGAYERASELYQASLATAQAAGLHQETAAALNAIATTGRLRGRPDVVERAAALLRELGNDRAAAQAFNNLGTVSVDAADWGAAEMSFAAAKELAERVDDPRLLGLIQVNQAAMYVLRQNLPAARACCDAAHAIFSQLGSERGLAEAHRLYGAIFREIGQHRRAEMELQLALRLAQSCGHELLEAEVEDETARLLVAQGRTREALQALNRAARLLEATAVRREVTDVQRRLDRLEETYFRTLQLMEFESVEATNPATVGRYERVADLACRLAAALGCTGRELTWLRIASYLYDVGKASLPVELLNKAGALDEAEQSLMRTHAAGGEELVAELGFPAPVRELVRSHHERWDGGGYPDGLRGADIPLNARVLAIAGAFAALTGDRSFRPALSPAEALQTMQADAGSVFDPELLRLFPSVLAPSPVPE